jgi:hypothetical protein
VERYQNNIQDQYGNAISGVTVTVRKVSDGSIASLFSDDGVTAKSNPFTNDSDGELFFYAANDRYDIFFTGAVTDQKDDVILFDGAGITGTLEIQTDTDAPAGPTGQVGTGTLDIYDLGSSDRLASWGFYGSTNGNLRFRNDVHAGHVELTGQNTAGTEVFLVTGDPDGDVTLYHNGIIRAAARTTGIFGIRSDTSTDTENRLLTGYHQDLTARWQLGNPSVAELQLRSFIDGGPVKIRANDTGSVERTMIDADPDGTIKFYSGAVLRYEVLASGVVAMYSDGSTDTEPRVFRFHHADGTERGVIGYGGDDVFAIRNGIHAGHVEISGEDTGGIPRIFFNGDPDGITSLRGDTDVEIMVAVGAETAIYCTANLDVALYYNNQEQFRTSDEAGADIGMGAEVRHNDDSFYPVGMNVAPEGNALDSGNETLANDLVGKMLTYNTATARSLFFNNDGNIKLGAMFALKVGPSAGTLTGDGGTGVQIRWWNGSGWTTTAAAGNITIGVGSYTIWKETDTLYWIDGPTLS